MGQSLVPLYVHLIFGTKYRKAYITKSAKPKLHSYLAGTLKNYDSPAIIINSMPEHVHLLFRMSKNYPLAKIVEEVKQQIVYGLDDALLNVQEHAYRKVEHTVNRLTEEIQRRRFFYQNLIYQINQEKKYEYEEIMKEEIELDERIDKIIKVQYKYNEINNHDIPKLFSKYIEKDVIPTAVKLSAYKNIKHTVQKLLLKALKNDNLNFVQKTQIKDILKEKYAWEEEKSAE